jgi:hypothetical protein
MSPHDIRWIRGPSGRWHPTFNREGKPRRRFKSCRIPHRPLAQWSERRAFNPRDVSSNLTESTKFKKKDYICIAIVLLLSAPSLNDTEHPKLV